MGLFSVIAAVLVLVLVLAIWARRASETVDMTDVGARRRSAAAWMANGEIDEAERMLRAAIEVLRDWPRSVAQGDLASLLMACEREEEAIDELKWACQAPAQLPADQEEKLELRIRLAHLLVRADRLGEAEGVLVDAAPEAGDSILAALAVEALAEFYVDQERCDEALEILRPAVSLLSSQGHDRAAAAAVTLAHALQRSKAISLWDALADLPVDLQSAAVVNLCDRLHSFAPNSAKAMLEALLTRLDGKVAWQWESQQLRAAAETLVPEPV